MATEIVRVSVPLHEAGSSITFDFVECEQKTIRLPFEALGDAEEVRQSAFRLIEKYGKRIFWVSFDRTTQMFSGVVSLTDEEVRHIMDISDMLQKMEAIVSA